jgi:O-antigen/teichoic acid export membrane protein
MNRVRPMRVRPSWNVDSFTLLFKTGITIFATDYVASTASTFDKVVLLKYGSVEQLGFYTLALSAYSAFQIVPQSIAHYIYPRMSHHLGRTNSPRVIWGIAWKINLVVLGCMLPLAVCGSLLMPMAVKLLFPKYIAGTHAAQIALFSAVAGGAATGVNALLSMKAWVHLIAYQLLYALFLVASPFLGVMMFSSPLTGVAYGILIANAAAAIFGLAITFLATHRDIPQSGTMADNSSRTLSAEGSADAA